jgi:hypothetical protein
MLNVAGSMLASMFGGWVEGVGGEKACQTKRVVMKAKVTTYPQGGLMLVEEGGDCRAKGHNISMERDDG